MRNRLLQTAALLALLLPAAAWGAGVLSKFKLSAHHTAKGAYALIPIASPTLGDTIALADLYSYNVTLAPGSYQRLATGYYRVTWEALGNRPGASANFGANVQITPQYAGLPVQCMTASWETFFSNPDVHVDVYCFNTVTQAATDSTFSILMMF